MLGEPQLGREEEQMEITGSDQTFGAVPTGQRRHIGTTATSTSPMA